MKKNFRYIVKKFSLLLLTLRLFSYTVTTCTSDSGAVNGTLRFGFVNSEASINFSEELLDPGLCNGRLFSPSTPYTLNTNTTLSFPVFGWTLHAPTTEDTLFNLGNNNLSIRHQLPEGTAIPSEEKVLDLKGKINTGGASLLLFDMRSNNRSATIDSDISGGADVVFNFGQFTVLGDITVTGDSSKVEVNGFSVILNGDVEAESVDVISGTLRGSQTITGGLIVRSGASVKPGSSIGTMTINGNVEQRTGSNFEIEIEPLGSSSLHDINGSYTIESGVSFTVDPNPGDYNTNRNFRVVSATGGVTGRFDSIAENPTNNTHPGAYHLEYAPTTIDLYFFSSQCTPAYLLANLSEQANNFQANLLQHQSDIRIMQRNAPCHTPLHTFQGYIVGDYTNGHTAHTVHMLPSSYRLGGFQVGTSYAPIESFLTTFFLGYSHGYSTMYNNCAKTNSNNYSVGLLFEYFWNLLSLDLSTAYTFAKYDAKRFHNNTEENNGSPGANLLNAECRLVFNTKIRGCDVRPLLGARYLGNWIQSYDETKSKIEQLHYSSDNWSELIGFLGVLLSWDCPIGSSIFTPHAKVEWIEHFLRNKHTVTFGHHAGQGLDGKIAIKNSDYGYLALTGGFSGTLKNCITIDGSYEVNLFKQNAPTQNYRASVAWNY